MNPCARVSLVVVALGALVALTAAPASAAAEPADPAAFPLEGTWRWNFTMPDGSLVRPKLKLTTEKGEIKGIASFRPGSEAPITNVLVEGDRIRFDVVRQREGQEIVTTYAGHWTSNAITGKIESNWAGEKQSYDWEAMRAHLGVEGMWRWTNTFPRPFGNRGFGGPGGSGGGEQDNATNGTASAARTNQTLVGATNIAENAERPRGERPPRSPGRGGPGGPGGPGGGGRGGFGRGFETRLELEQEGERLTGKTVSRFGRPVAITNGFFTNGIVYFEIERVFFDNRTLTKYQGKQNGDTILGTMESEVDGEDRTNKWEALRVD